MNASDVFLSCMLTLILFNLVYVFIIPNAAWNITQGLILGFFVMLLPIGIVAGIQLLGSGLNGESIKIAFGCGALLSMLFSVTIGTTQIGMGLASNVMNCFGEEFFGIGLIIASVIGIMAFISGLIIITGGYSSG